MGEQGSVRKRPRYHLHPTGRVLLTIGYENFLVDMNGFDVSRERHAVWAKLPAIIEAFDMYPDTEWVWWLDIDTIIMAPHVELYEYLLKPDVLKGLLLRDVELVLNERVVPGRTQDDHFKIEHKGVSLQPICSLMATGY